MKLLANIFVDGVILQRDVPIKFWGETDAYAKVEITFNHILSEVTADATGNWEVEYEPLPAGSGALELTVVSGNVVEHVTNILMGDVWICAGQSNMELPMSRTRRVNADEIKTASNDQIREYHVPETYNFQAPQVTIPVSPWLKVQSGDTEKMTAVGYFFAKKLHAEIGVPIGLVLTALGGTPIESWMSKEILTDYPELLKQTETLRPAFINEVMATENALHNAYNEKINRFDLGLCEKWFTADFDDATWKRISLDQPWDEIDDLKATGVIWLRKKVEIIEPQQADVILGTISDADEVYINGIKIGETGYKYPPRDYPVTNLQRGENIIAIRVIANGGTGGFTYGKKRRLLFADGTEMPLSDNWKYCRALACPAAPSQTFFRNAPTGNYNGMIAPLTKFPMKGVIWYQGETNAGSPAGYHEKFQAMITDWRRNWQLGNFPFIFAQLANWSPKGGKMNWELLRDEQRKTHKTPNAQMVVTYDIGEDNDLHPLDKQTVGTRMASVALSLAYGQDIVATGPTLHTVTRAEEQITITFTPSTSKLTINKGDVVKGFSIWVNDIEIPMAAQLNGETGEVVIKTIHAAEATHISYAWADDPVDANLYNGAELPTVPFKVEIN